MTFSELTKDQKLVLKQRMVDDEIYETEKRSASWGELAHADRLVPDERLEERYGATVFSPEDFA